MKKLAQRKNPYIQIERYIEQNIYREKTIYIEIYRYNVYFGAKNNKKRVYLLLYIDIKQQIYRYIENRENNTF